LNNPRSAFTLVELLLSVVLLAVILAVTASVLSGVLTGVGIVGAGESLDNLVGAVDDLLSEDLAFLTAPAKNGNLTIRSDSSGTTSFTFYSACGARTAWGDAPVLIHKITYQVKPTAYAKKGLFRGEEPLVKTSGAYYDAPVLLTDDVTSFTVEGFDGKEWHPGWPLESGADLPALLRIHIEIEPARGVKRTVTIESAPAIESHPKPEEERRASGGAGTPAANANKPGAPTGNNNAPTAPGGGDSEGAQ
jgi:prepilin-type N-terminal cleavage/methylation domain-containing protein